MLDDKDEYKTRIWSAFLFIGLVILAIAALLYTTACTYNVSLVHTEGTATDVIDTDQKADPTVSPTLTIPASML